MSDGSRPEPSCKRTDVETSLHELLEGLDIVGLGTDCADDRGLRVSDMATGKHVRYTPFAGIFAPG